MTTLSLMASGGFGMNHFTMEKTLDKRKHHFRNCFLRFLLMSLIIFPKYKSRFKEGDVPIHKCVEYTDFALKRFFEETKNKPWFDNTILFLLRIIVIKFIMMNIKTYKQVCYTFLSTKPNSSYVGVDDD
jgi:hypothetical protein